MTTTARPRGRYEKWVCPHRGAETCECRRAVLTELLTSEAQTAQQQTEVLPVRRDQLAAGCAWLALGFCALYLLSVLVRYAWAVLVG